MNPPRPPEQPGLGPDSEAAAALREGSRAMDVLLDEPRVERLMAFLALLMQWNRAYRLTAISEPLDLVRRHLLDALSIVAHLRGPQVLDVGSGAGVPGLVLAIAVPELSVTLLDPALKRTRFLVQALHDLGVANARVERARLDGHIPDEGYDSVVSRASLGFADLVRGALPLLAEEGRILAMLGKPDRALAAELPEPFTLRIQRLKVPGLDAARHLAIVSRRKT